MYSAKDLMRPQVPVVNFDLSITAALSVLKEQKTTFALVQASPDRFHGVLTQARLVPIFIRYKAQPAKDLLIHYREFLEPVQLVQEIEPLHQVLRKLVGAVGHRLFVINDQQHVIGCILPEDVLPVLAPQQGSIEVEEARKDLPMYENFFEGSPFMMHSVNSQGIIQLANQILHKILGYEFGELVGKTIFQLYAPENHAPAAQGLKSIFEKGYYKVIHSQMLRKDGTSIEVELVSRALKDQSGRIVGTLTVSRPLNMELMLEALP